MIPQTRKQYVALLFLCITLILLYWNYSQRKALTAELEVQTPTLQQTIHAEAHPIPSHTSSAHSSINSPHPSNTVSMEEFEKITTEALRAIPTVQDLRNLSPEEVHHTPHQILDAGMQLGNVAAALDQNPELKAEAQKFYEKCLDGADYPSSIRALCLFHLRELSPKEFAEGTSRASSIPEEVIRLANAL